MSDPKTPDQDKLEPADKAAAKAQAKAFDDMKAEAEKAGAKAAFMVPASNPKAQPALRVDH